MSQESSARIESAVVIGGSIAGLLTARILTDHVKQITVIERDVLPETPTYRKGAPQARHPHAMLVRGQQILESLFPGMADELLANGAIDINMGDEIGLNLGDSRVASYESALTATACSRPLLEHVIYRRLRAFEQIDFLDQHAVTGIRTDETNTCVTGVHVRQRGSANSQEQTIPADLVVDASGRNSQMPDWLGTLGFTPPLETTIDAKAGYATRIYQQPAKSPSWKALYSIPQAPNISRGCILAPAEGGQWYATLIGFNGDQPPTDEAGFLAFARSVPMPEFYDAITRAEPITAPYGFRSAANRLRHYDRLPRYLEGLLATGDSVYALNPVYGQGMTVAALGALALDKCLQFHLRYAAVGNLSGLAQAYQKALARVIATPWQMATGQDLRWPVAADNDGKRIGPITRLMQRYLDRTLMTMTHNGDVAAAFAQVQHMAKSPLTLFSPRIAWQVWRDGQPVGTGHAPLSGNRRRNVHRPRHALVPGRR